MTGKIYPPRRDGLVLSCIYRKGTWWTDSMRNQVIQILQRHYWIVSFLQCSSLPGLWPHIALITCMLIYEPNRFSGFWWYRRSLTIGESLLLGFLNLSSFGIRLDVVSEVCSRHFGKIEDWKIYNTHLPRSPSLTCQTPWSWLLWWFASVLENPSRP